MTIPFIEEQLFGRTGGLLGEEPYLTINPTSGYVGIFDAVISRFHETVSFVTVGTSTRVQPEYQLLQAIVTAPVEQRFEVMRVLGLIEGDDDGYVPPGPDPQTVDFELLARLEPERQDP